MFMAMRKMMKTRTDIPRRNDGAYRSRSIPYISLIGQRLRQSLAQSRYLISFVGANRTTLIATSLFADFTGSNGEP